MRFKIVTVGWKCADWWEQTLASVEAQSVDNWDVWVTYDGGDDAGPAIKAWCDDHGSRWHFTQTDRQQFAVRNQWETIRRLHPADDDIVVFLDLDGDQLAHRDVLARLAQHYGDGVLLTYGSYQPVPPTSTCAPATPFPEDVVITNTYRQHILKGGGCHFNHLRTMKGCIAKSIPLSYFKWESGGWYEGGTDYIFMTAGLELAGGRYRCIPEVLLLYNHANPNADNISHPAVADAATRDFLHRPPLAPWAPKAPTGDPYLSHEQRREILRDYGNRYGLRVFIETGTAGGDTPAALMGDFDQLYTIEVGDTAYQAAVERFAGSRVICLHGDSALVLPLVLATVGDTPALLWMDGHFCGGDRGDKDTPVLEELAAVFASPVPHVVLIDDARLFEGMSHYGEHDWPHIDEVVALATAHGYHFEVVDDIVRLTP